jgi:GNAT superfamily N-acetyltransferase
LDAITLARIAPEHEAAINAMIMRSKAHWGYDHVMLAIMKPVLRVDMNAAALGRAIAAWSGGQPVGLVQISQPYEGERGIGVLLDLLFIAPEAIGTGLGRRLYLWAIDQARAAEASRLDILSDPFARGFYTAMGAVYIEDRASRLVAGRSLPWLEHRLDQGAST